MQEGDQTTEPLAALRVFTAMDAMLIVETDVAVRGFLRKPRRTSSSPDQEVLINNNRNSGPPILN